MCSVAAKRAQRWQVSKHIAHASVMGDTPMLSVAAAACPVAPPTFSYCICNVQLVQVGHGAGAAAVSVRRIPRHAPRQQLPQHHGIRVHVRVGAIVVLAL